MKSTKPFRFGLVELVNKYLKSTMKTSLLILTCLLFLNSIAQINYLELSKNQESSCNAVDSSSVMNEFLRLDSISKYEITEGEEFYLYDVSMNYYYQNLLWKRQDDLVKCIEYSRLCWEKYKNKNALWNLAFNMVWSDNPHKGIEYLDLFVKAKLKNNEEVDYEQVYALYKIAYDKTLARIK